MVTICTASLTLNNSTFCPHSVFMCFVWISEQTAIISLYSINWLVFIRDLTLYSPVVTICLTFNNSTFCPHSVFVCIWEQTAIISLYSIDWLVCIIQTECVYCAVRTESNVVQSIVSLWKWMWNTPSPPCMLIFERVLSMSRTYRVLHLLVRWVLLQEDELLVQLSCHLHRHFLPVCPYTRITVTCTAGHATLPAHCFHITEVLTVSPERRSNHSAPACVTLLVVIAVFLGMRPLSGPSAC